MKTGQTTKIVKVKFYVSTNFVGAAEEEILDLTIPIDATEEQECNIIQECYTEWMHEQLDSSWEIIE